MTLLIQKRLGNFIDHVKDDFLIPYHGLPRWHGIEFCLCFAVVKEDREGWTLSKT